MTVNRTRIAALAGTAALLAGGGTALAAHGTGERQARCEARLARIAEARGMTVAELTAQLRARLDARIQLALAADRITPHRAQWLIRQFELLVLCKAAPIGVGVHWKAPMSSAAAAYLELTPRELRVELRGTSLAAPAVKQGKSVEGLQAAMLAPAKAKLERLVAADRITQARADRLLGALEGLVERLVNRTFPAR